jgi:regulator of PEP synthase PpsR (kinase-PPPase family)
MAKTVQTVFVLSDGTGETASIMVRAALVQYRQADITVVRCKNVRTEDQVAAVLDEAKEREGFVAFTVVSPHLKTAIEEGALQRTIIAIDLLGPLLVGLDRYFGISNPSREVGLMRTLNEKYFRRIEAIEYTVKHDDGKEVRDLDQADIVLVGISRTSKTPLSIFLSHKGWKVANVPIVLNVPPPSQLKEIDQRKIVALTIDPDKLSRIRQKRVEKLGDSAGDYAQMRHIQEEIEYALRLFRENKRWPVFNVTERALEETAAEITKIVAARLGLKDESFF